MAIEKVSGVQEKVTITSDTKTVAENPIKNELLFVDNTKNCEEYPDLEIKNKKIAQTESDTTEPTKSGKFLKGALRGMLEALSSKTMDFAVIGFIAIAAMGYAALGGIICGSFATAMMLGYALYRGNEYANKGTEKSTKEATI